MYHEDLAQGRWQTMTLAEQLGNVGSEFSRAIKAREAGNQGRFENASDRFLELLDLTVVDPRWRGYRRRELARVKEASGETLYGIDQSGAASLEKYFFQFALLARANK